MTSLPLSAFAPDNDDTPLWLRAMHSALPIAPQFVVHGGIRDRHRLRTAAGALDFPPTEDAIARLLAANGFDALVRYDLLGGLRIAWAKDEQTAQQVTDWLSKAADQNQRRARPGRQFEAFEDVDRVIGLVAAAAEPRAAILIDYVSQEQQGQGSFPEPVRRAMLASLMNAHAARSHLHQGIRDKALMHPAIWLVDRPNDLPHWMLTGDGIRQIPITAPDLDTRRRVARVLTGTAASDTEPDAADTTGQDTTGGPEHFADVTEGFSVRGMMEARQMVDGPNTGVDAIDAAIRAYRVGVSQNPWQGRELRAKLLSGKELLTRRVKGQPRATQKVLDAIVRSAMGLTSAHQAKPGAGIRGVLFFAGPTGVGKTEMAKAIAELVFGQETALIRFDMSEFRDEASDARLIGAPPGYVGHGAGGELTNAVRRQPFSVLLFDEIEKANAGILDKFLQILSDGRLTDGSGDTVYFTDALIVFTSNKGVEGTEALSVDTPEEAARYEAEVRGAIERYFARPPSEGGLGRPELLGRIGDNIVVFRPIRGAVADLLARQFIENIRRRVGQDTGTRLELAPDALEDLVAMVTTPGVLERGGREIANELQSLLTDPVARALFAAESTNRLVVTGFGRDAEGTPTVVTA
ncbi:MAG: AAA family ATPase [Bifidobacteriaceae bacterium]|jgi:flagellar biosynthesis GTPase FlhF|nr:AAA family ATPase [Bifidobacteriaceae bacterium]